jgi:threonine dehydratase
VRPGEFPFKHLQTYLDEIVLISEQEIADTFRTLLTRAKILVEPAGVVASAGFLSGKVDTSLKTVAAITGGNVTDEVIQKMLSMSA